MLNALVISKQPLISQFTNSLYFSFFISKV